MTRRTSYPPTQGKCANMHGHTWHLTVEIKGEVDKKTSMVMDLTDLKNIIKIAINPLDHKLLNSLDIQHPAIEIPTCENILRLLKGEILQHPLFHLGTGGFELYSITLQEGDGGYAKWIS